MNEQRLIVMGALAAVVALGGRAGEPYRSLAAYGSLAVLGVTGVIPPVMAVLVAAVGGGIHLAALLARRRGEASVRDYALQQGVRIDEIEREVPFSSGRGRALTLRRTQCTRYAIPRLGDAAPAEWAFLMRTKKDGAQFPNGFLFRAPGDPPGALKELLTKIARASDQEYLEFEATPSEVAAYWEAWGGAKQFDRIHGYLRGLAAY